MVCGATRYTGPMIKFFRHAGIASYFLHGKKDGIQPHHAQKLSKLLGRLNVSTHADDMNLPGWGFHALKGNLQGHWSVSVNGNWRLTFTFEGTDAILVDYQDYH